MRVTVASARDVPNSIGLNDAKLVCDKLQYLMYATGSEPASSSQQYG